MKKRECDFCGEDVIKNPLFLIEVYDDIEDKPDLENDACELCKTKIINAINKMKKEIKKDV